MNPTPASWPAITLALLALLCLLACLIVFSHGLLARRQAQRLKALRPASTIKPQTETP